ncbi:lipoxygenase [Tolypothrix tenuis PCC 7101]|uniref:Lipoxygenase n=1 Tax=Tolypothrix tenuis PCC 7101 TaxID=231146 RepID=A0A1Z4N2A7_9CYAN|nr:lipoxygenase [Aulosira sp. FACHB-113]BAY99857.1 lipoxygenase [Tolypothrix tenuis PCC 7101]BAZ76221.1 lipoxygenase [Aulosira laxa NIES-50]
MLPTLPQNDPNPSVRQAQLARSRYIYKFTHKYQGCPGNSPLPNGIALAEHVPPDQEFTPDYLLRVTQVNATLLANHAAIDLEYLTGGNAGSSFSLSDWLGLTRAVGNKHLLFSTPLKVTSRIDSSFPINLDAYDAMFALIQKPEIVYKLKQGRDVCDRAFAWQRLAGANPMVLQGITHLPPTFQLTNQQYQAAIRDENDTLEAAGKEGRLYVADYSLLSGLPHGTWSDGVLGVPRNKYIFDPIALFAWKKETPLELGGLLPVAIQCQQTQDSISWCRSVAPIFTPNDGIFWEMAKAIVQSADGNIQEMVYHLGHTHFVMEAVIVAAERNLAAVHPIHVLLKPHFEFTLSLNDYAYKHLIAPGGAVDSVMGSTLEGSLTLMLRGMKNYAFNQALPPLDFKNRGVDNLDGLPEYPYRDDGLLVWTAIRKFVSKYLRLYYTNDIDVKTDTELQNWVKSIGNSQEGNIQGVEEIQTLEKLIDMVALIIFTASAQHGSLNYAQFPMMGYVPNVSGAIYAEAPTNTTPQNQDNYLMLLAPVQQALIQFTTLYQLSNVRYGKLGHYPCLYFQDSRVLPLVKEFQQNLAVVESEILDRDQTRFMSYPFLLPSQIGNSIFI